MDQFTWFYIYFI